MSHSYLLELELLTDDTVTGDGPPVLELLVLRPLDLSAAVGSVETQTESREAAARLSRDLSYQQCTPAPPRTFSDQIRKILTNFPINTKSITQLSWFITFEITCAGLHCDCLAGGRGF